MKFTANELIKIDYLVYEMHCVILNRIAEARVNFVTIPIEFQNINGDTIVKKIREYRNNREKLTGKQDVIFLLDSLDYIKKEFDKLNLDIDSFKNSDLMSFCIWGGTNRFSDGILGPEIVIPSHLERLKYICIDFKYQVEYIQVNTALNDFWSIYRDCVGKTIKQKEACFTQNLYLFNNMIKANPFKQMDTPDFKDHDWMELYNHCLEIYCSNISIGHKFIVPDMNMYKYACYLLYFLNRNNDTFKKSQLSNFKINLRKKTQRKKQNAQGIKTLEIKLKEDTVKKLKELQQYNKLTQSEIIEILINNDYKNSLG
ncbi:hypothetical protein [Thorsellia kenyensis]|uniref:SAP domain-containing protein n=1 Tax=Thorsellia kenyensis TaxID=1549888 RepID=A0ABV6C965_9GAMM